MCEEDAQKLRELPPSSKLVFVVLSHEGRLTQKRLIEETRLSERTVRYALGRLGEIGALDEEIHLRDARQTLYTATYSGSSCEDEAR